MGNDKYKLSLFQNYEDAPRLILYFNTSTEVKMMITLLNSSWHMPKKYKLEMYEDEYYKDWIECDLSIFLS